MKPQSASFLEAADRDLGDARTILAANVPHQGARLAYYAQFHAAKALIFERTGKISRTHSGVDREFHKLSRTEATLAAGRAAELSAAYRYTQSVDYEPTGPMPITPTIASQAIATAERFVADIRQALAEAPAGPL